MEEFNYWKIAYYGVPALALLIIFFNSFFTVAQQEEAIVERFGKFHKSAKPGLRMKIPFVDQIAIYMELRVQQSILKIESITKDKVSVIVQVAVQYYILPDKTYDAFYKLDDPSKQMTAYVFDVVRARLPKLDLDQAYDQKDEIANAVKAELAAIMDDFGYGIQTALVTDIDPDANVKKSMNEINAAQRFRMAAQEKGEAEKILKIKEAEAESASKILQGEGIAGQRKAIIAGLSASVDDFAKAIPGSSAQDVMSLVLMTQYFDTVKEVGARSNSNAIFIQHSPQALGQMRNDMMEAMLGVRKLPDENS